MPVIDIHQQLIDALEVVRNKKATLDNAVQAQQAAMQQHQALVSVAEADYEEAAKRAASLHDEFGNMVASLLPAASRSRSA